MFGTQMRGNENSSLAAFDERWQLSRKIKSLQNWKSRACAEIQEKAKGERKLLLETIRDISLEKCEQERKCHQSQKRNSGFEA